MPATPPSPSCCLMILNYNGQELLRECLPTALAAAEALGAPCPVVVLDNCSTKDDLDFLAREFPQVERVLARSNDYLFSFNEALAQRSEEVVIILNNDMTFDAGFIAPLLRYFHRPEIFAVTAKVLDWDRTTVITARSRLVPGKFWYSLNRTFDDAAPCYTFYAAGGAAAYRRSMFLELGGFDRLFRPAYYEEVDLSYRAWRRGWRTLYEPASVMVHRRAATLSQQKSKDRWTRIITRNQVLFNLKDPGTAAEVLVFLTLLPWRTLRAALRGDRLTALALAEAWLRLPVALWGRFQQRGQGRLSDQELIAIIETGKVEDPAQSPVEGPVEAPVENRVGTDGAEP